MLKKTMETGMLCMTNRKTIHVLMKNTWIGGLGASYHFTKDGTGLYDITDISLLVQGSLGNTSATKMGKFHMKVHQIHCNEMLQMHFNISSPSTPTLDGKKHWLLVIEDSTNYAWSYL